MSRHPSDKPNWSQKLDMWSEHRIALNLEVKNHPELLSLLAKHDIDEFETKLCEIAAYCEVILDGQYTEADLDGVCKELCDKLVFKRTGITFAREDITNSKRIH